MNKRQAKKIVLSLSCQVLRDVQHSSEIIIHEAGGETKDFRRLWDAMTELVEELERRSK